MEAVTEAEKNNAGCFVWRNRWGEMTDTASHSKKKHTPRYMKQMEVRNYTFNILFL